MSFFFCRSSVLDSTFPFAIETVSTLAAGFESDVTYFISACRDSFHDVRYVRLACLLPGGCHEYTFMAISACVFKRCKAHF